MLSVVFDYFIIGISWQVFFYYWLMVVTVWTFQEELAQGELNVEQYVRVKKQKKKSKSLTAPVETNRIDKSSKKKKKSKKEKTKKKS